MFQSARLILTGWYLAIIMAVSLLFSLIIYSGINQELQRFEQIEEIVQDHFEEGLPVPRKILDSRVKPDMIEAARTRIITTLGFINLGILAVAGAAGYFLAGRTLAPIKKMVDEQRRFITDASHELRTPLTSLRSEIEVGLRNKNLTLTDAKKLLTSNLEEVISLSSLSNNLLDLAQSGKPWNGDNYTQISLRERIDTAIKKLNAFAKKQSITISANIDKDIVIYGIADRITELFIILIDNAIKYSPKETTIIVSAKAKTESVEVKVADFGYGIAKEDLPNIFDRFYRANKSRSKEEVVGYGLGLSIAKKIVDSHKGKISVVSKKNSGTTFTVILPRA